MSERYTEAELAMLSATEREALTATDVDDEGLAEIAGDDDDEAGDGDDGAGDEEDVAAGPEEADTEGEQADDPGEEQEAEQRK